MSQTLDSCVACGKDAVHFDDEDVWDNTFYNVARVDEELYRELGLFLCVKCSEKLKKFLCKSRPWDYFSIRQPFCFVCEKNFKQSKTDEHLWLPSCKCKESKHIRYSIG